MSVSAVGAVSSFSISYISTTSAVGAAGGAGGTSSCGCADGSGDSAKISPVGRLTSDLQQLQQKDPDKLKEVLSDIATMLKDASQQQSNGAEGSGSSGDFLSRLADRFQKAADTGDLSALRPPHGHGHGHGHVERAYALGSGATSDAAQAVGSTAASDQSSTASGKLNLRDLFSSILSQVQQALQG
jgi:hypothetical protein